MAWLLKRKIGQFFACVFVLSFYYVFISKTGILSMVIIVPDPPHPIKVEEKVSYIPEFDSLLSLKDTAAYLYHQHSSHQNLVSSKINEKNPKFFDEIQSQKNLRPEDFVAATEKLPVFCQNKGFDKKAVTKYPNSSMIISLIDVTADEAMMLLSKILRHTSEDLVDDVLITADVMMQTKEKEVLEQALDECSICRLFFMEGSIYQHRNSVARFARSSILVFVDARIDPFSDYWLEPLIFEVVYNPLSVVSPHLRLRKGNTGVTSQGFTRVGMTWDMEAIRIPLTPEQNSMLQNEKTFAVNQTSILKEVFAIRKDHFLDLGLFDVFPPPSSGGEHVSFSLKVINCGGEILTSFCSQVYLDIPEISLDQIHKYPRDYKSLSFAVNQQHITNYYDSSSLVWLDAYSSNLFSASIHRQKHPVKAVVIDLIDTSTQRSYQRPDSFHHRSHTSQTRLLKANMKSMECDTTNYRYILTKFQPKMIAIDRKTQKNGFIRSLDGMYSLGIETHSLMPSEILQSQDINLVKQLFSSNNGNNSSWPALVLTRFSSHWVGPFSYTMGMIQYNRLWCIAVAPGNVNDNNKSHNNADNNDYEFHITLEPCRIGTLSQMFIFKDNLLWWGGHGAKMCVSADAVTGGGQEKEEFRVSRGLFLTQCSNIERKIMNGSDVYFDLFKIDVEFIEEKS